jgi:wyosine [tRNA(Phe)-imidazoG37] synthetase (radical SAM superfamily)
MRYIFGPLKSRRLGNSLGINLTPYKVCTFDCIYCQLGKTTQKTQARQEYLPAAEILEELRNWLQNNPDEAKSLEYITFSGSGEPTLNIKIGELIVEIKKISNVPVAVITNASLLADPLVRAVLLTADLIVPSLDAVVPEVFEKIDQPQEGIKVEEIINGLISLRKEFRGQIWLEVMLVSGINDDLRYIKKLKEVADQINPDKIQINSPVRSSAEQNILPPDRQKLEKIKGIIGEKCEII